MFVAYRRWPFLWADDEIEDRDAYWHALQKARGTEVAMILEQLDLGALTARASALRDGVQCRVVVPEEGDETAATQMGNYNFHLELCFEDGVQWIARFKRTEPSPPPPAIREYLVKSEAATYRFLEKTRVPAPKVFEVVSDSSNPVGAGYILMEKVPGQSLSSMLPTADQTQKVLAQIADMYEELHKYPFETMGSLDQMDFDHIGPVAYDLVAQLDPDHGPDFPGPFRTAKDFYVSMLSRVLDLIVGGELYPDWAVDTYLVHRFMLDLVPLLPGINDQNFYLRHPDDSGSHIMVDDDFNITGIIDWEWAYTVPKCVAFTSFAWLWDVSDFFDGINELSDKEKHFAQLFTQKETLQGTQESVGRYVREGKGIQRFHFLMAYEFYDRDFESYTVMFGALRKAFDVDASLNWEEWRSTALERYADDEGLQKLLQARVAVGGAAA
ncbi:MAG: hypothetical protein M4579_005537 [Chaenotheca gracillima]|nr:MAG: hypothetical protein M4579_005537 [Chaenotheca gracillima]